MSAESRNRIVVSVGTNHIISFTVYHGRDIRRYHVTTISETYHITRDGSRDHYGFRTEPKAGTSGWNVTDRKMKKEEIGSRKGICHVLSELPQPEQNWFKDNYGEILAVKAGEQKTYYV